MDLSCKNINYTIPPFDSEDDLINLTASESITTSTIKDTCGNERIVFPCTAEDCGDVNDIYSVSPCLNKPMEFKTDVDIDGNLNVGKLSAISLAGDGCDITNTDNVEVVDFKYTPEEGYHSPKELHIQTQNTKNCGESPVNDFSIDMHPFLDDTVVVDFDYDCDGEDPDCDTLHIITKNFNTDTEKTFLLDLSKYNNRQEQYVESGVCSPEGIITFTYNLPDAEDFEVDISNAVHGIPVDGDFDPYTGELTLFADNGDTLNIPGFTTNNELVGEVILDENWDGHVYFHIVGKNIMVNFVGVQALKTPPAYIGRLPIKLPNFKNTYKTPDRDDNVIYRTVVPSYKDDTNPLFTARIAIYRFGEMWFDGHSRMTSEYVINDTFTLVCEETAFNLPVYCKF